jgi:hypothetical protein
MANRREQLLPHVEMLRGLVFDLVNCPGLQDTESRVAMDLAVQAGHASSAFDAAADDAAVLSCEYSQLRPLIQDLRSFKLRNHLTIAWPLWGAATSRSEANTLYFAGGPDQRLRLQTECEARQLRLTSSKARWGAARSRWEELCGASLCVLDFSAANMSGHASAAHALGCALALGVYPLVIADARAELPFDVDIAPVLPSELGAGLDDAMFRSYDTGATGSVEATLRHAVQEFGARTPEARALSKLADEGKCDPYEADALLKLVLQQGPAGAQRLYPAWPGGYPNPNQPTCFHIMPFSAAFNPYRDCVRLANEAARVTYRRGDETGDPNVLASIWQEICRATFIVVDLTGMNVNVCIELGMAEALGRRVLLVKQDVDNSPYFPEIAKTQIRSYRTDDDGRSLRAFLTEFLTGSKLAKQVQA